MAYLWSNEDNNFNGDTLTYITDDIVCRGDEFLTDPQVILYIDSVANNDHHDYATIETTEFGYTLEGDEYYSGRFGLYLRDWMEEGAYHAKYIIQQACLTGASAQLSPSLRT